MSAFVTPTSNGLISQVQFQISPDGEGQWTTFATVTTTTSTAAPYQYQATLNVPQAGPYDIQAIATQTDNEQGSAVAKNLVVANGATYVALANIGSPVSQNPSQAPGGVTLTATPAQGGNTPDTVTFEICPVTDDCFANQNDPNDWTMIGPVQPQVVNGTPTGNFVATLPPESDGLYDVTVTATDATSNPPGDAFEGDVLQVEIDNTGPTATVNNPGASLSDTVALTASAWDAGSGVAAVKFEVSPAGANNWTTIGTATCPSDQANPPCSSYTPAATTQPQPYTASFDTRQFANGSYDLRVEAIDVAGNAAPSPVTSITVSNSNVQRFDHLAITDFAAPASNIKLLGELNPSPDHETWALGQTNAPPPAGLANQYTAQGSGQWVLLRYTDGAGWQIVDVLRVQDADGTTTPFELNPASPAQVSGAMSTTGEAWITLRQTNPTTTGPSTETAIFHRLPGGQFIEDMPASSLLRPLLATGTSSVKLGTAADGTTYGTILSSQSPLGFFSAPSPTAAQVSVTTRMEYGELVAAGDDCDSSPTASPCWALKGSPFGPNPLPASYVAPFPNVTITLEALAPTGLGTGWGLLEQGTSLILGRYDQNGWDFVGDNVLGAGFVGHTGLDALDLTNEFAPTSQDSAAATAQPEITTPFAISADSACSTPNAQCGVWIGATVGAGSSSSAVVARYVTSSGQDTSSGQVVGSWCTGRSLGTAVVQVLGYDSFGCGQPLDGDHPAAVPNATFATPSDGVVADALTTNFIDVYAHGAWTSVAAPGFGGFNGGQAMFVDPTDGWLVGPNGLALVSATPPPAALASWPEANRNPLTSVALPPGQSTTDTAGALAVGLYGTALHYDPTAGWLVDPTPTRAQHIGLYGVGFAGPSTAFAVGQEGTILDWNGTAWSEDPQSVSLTTATLNAVAFAPDGEGWAVGANGTILHYNGTDWSPEQVDGPDADKTITSVTVAGRDVFAIAGGDLIERLPDGSWESADSLLPTNPAPPAGSLELVSGLPDGGLVVAGKSLLMTRQSASASLGYAPQSFQGIPVALAAFRDSTGELRAFVSVAPPITTTNGVLTDDLGGFPAGDGDLLLQTSGGWEDLSHAQPPAQTGNAQGDGFVQPDPVLAVAASPDGSHAWAVGGYSGTHAADGIGTDDILSARPAGWLASAIWRYDASGSAQSTTVSSSEPTIPAQPDTVSFAFFSNILCKVECAAVQDAQPDVNLSTAAQQIAAFAQQPGGPAFAMLGGNASSDAVDLGQLPALLSPLGNVPTYAAYGPLDGIPTSNDPTSWADVFANAPAPFGPAAAPAGITPDSSGDSTGPVNKYYDFDVTQNGATLRVIVLDNSAGSLEASAPGQTAWLSNQLTGAQAAGVPVIVVASDPLNTTDFGAASDGDAVAAQLAAAGVLAVFTGSGGTTPSSQPDLVTQVPANAPVGAPQIPEYQGAALTYQQPGNNGVLWYDVSVDTATSSVNVQAIPVIASLALEPLGGLTAARSSTLSFAGIARRPSSTIATTPSDDTFPGFDQYVSIPSATCSGCIGPSYSFTSSDPIVGNFVAATAPGSPFPKLTATGATIPSATSGLFCAFNSGTTTVSVTSGLLTSSLPVTVEAGGYGPPCGTVAGGTSTNVITIPGRVITKVGGASSGVAPLLPGSNSPVSTLLPKLTIPPPPLVVVPAVHAHPPALKHVPSPALPAVGQSPPVLAPPPQVGVPPIVPPLIPPALTPVPPGGATVSAQATARREEKARRHASQSAYTIRPAGTSATDWFFPLVGIATVMALLLAAAGMRPGPRAKPALLELRDPGRQRVYRRF